MTQQLLYYNIVTTLIYSRIIGFKELSPYTKWSQIATFVFEILSPLLILFSASL